MSTSPNNDVNAQAPCAPWWIRLPRFLFVTTFHVIQLLIMVVVAVSACVMFWLVYFPPDIKPYIPEMNRFLSEETGLHITLADLSLDVGRSLSLKGENVSAFVPGGKGLVATAGEVDLTLAPLSWLFDRQPLRATLNSASVLIKRDSQGRLYIGKGALALPISGGHSDLSADFRFDFNRFQLANIRFRDSTITWVDEMSAAGAPKKQPIVLHSVQLESGVDRDSVFRFDASAELMTPKHSTARSGRVSASTRKKGMRDAPSTPPTLLMARTRITAGGQRRPDSNWSLAIRVNNVLFDAFTPYLTEVSGDSGRVGTPAVTRWLKGLRAPINIKTSSRWGPDQPLDVRWRLSVGHGSLRWPHLFKRPLPVDVLSASGTVRKQRDSSYILTIPKFKLKNQHGAFQGRLALKRLGSKQVPFIDLSASGSGTTAEQASNYYPESLLPEKLYTWLNQSIKSGRVTKVKARIRGPVDRIPFTHAKQRKDGHSNYIFSIAGEVKRGEVDFFPGLSTIKNANVELQFERSAMTIHVRDGVVGGSKRVRGTVRIPDILAEQPKLLIDAKADVTLEHLWRDFISSDVLQWDKHIGLTGSELHGPGNLSLSISMPLDAPDNAEYEGRINVLEARIKLPFLEEVISHFDGQIRFDHNRIFIGAKRAVFNEMDLQGRLEAKDYRKNPEKSKLQLKLQSTLDESLLVSWMAPLLGSNGMFSGSVPVELLFERIPGQNAYKFHTLAEINNVRLKGPMGWDILPGETGKLQVNGLLTPDGTVNLMKMDAKLGSLSFIGDGVFNAKQETGRFNLNNLFLGGSSGNVRITRRAASTEKRPDWQVRADLKRLELLPVWIGDEVRKPLPASSSALYQYYLKQVPPNWPLIDLYLDAERISLANGEDGYDLELKAEMQDREVRVGFLKFYTLGTPEPGEEEDTTATIDKETGLKRYRQEMEGRFEWLRRTGFGPYEGKVTIESRNIGHLLRGLKVHRGMRGGKGTFSVDLLG
ncbi:MAG: hypothetical protein HQL50_01485, partial [Magnetococcales bacterium]|nr:hypothetical protein [Magnetococcales bacterium]